jgi:hypothetical protein
MEAILDAPLERGGSVTIQDVYNKLEKELYTSRLTDKEKQRKIAEIELAVANEKESIKHLEEGLDNALTNDAYFKDEDTWGEWLAQHTDFEVVQIPRGEDYVAEETDS